MGQEDTRAQARCNDLTRWLLRSASSALSPHNDTPARHGTEAPRGVCDSSLAGSLPRGYGGLAWLPAAI
jgi:hypothetical protein